MGWTELQKAVEAARIHNVRVAVEFLVKDGKLSGDIQPTVRLLAEKVIRVAAERKVGWEEVFAEVVTGGELTRTDVMGGTDHPDPTLHSSPIREEREGLD